MSLLALVLGSIMAIAGMVMAVIGTRLGPADMSWYFLQVTGIALAEVALLVTAAGAIVVAARLSPMEEA